MNDKHFVIIGNGAGANRAADVLRAGDADARITLISDEFFPFYYRHLLRDFIVGDVEESDLMVRPTSYYKKNKIRIRLGQRVIKLDLDQKTIYLKHMEKVHYTKLLMCVGGKPRLPELYHGYRSHIAMLKTLDDARRIRALLKGVKNVIILGGDMVSVRISTTLVEHGYSVQFLLDEDSFWPLELTPERRDEFKNALTKKGVTVHSGHQIAHIEQKGIGVYQLKTHLGLELECDLICGFFGFIPNVDFLLKSGLDIDRGILVNEYLQTLYADVFAAGDCAQIYNQRISSYWVSIGWQNAEKLGEIAATNMLGDAQEADSLPENILSFSGIKVNTSWWKDL